MADVVLIHGTTQSPDGWERLVTALTDRRHRGLTVDLVGDPDRTTEEHAADVRRQLPDDLTDPVVVAHSGAGLVLPAVARSIAARRQVWLAAMVPDGHRSLVEEATAAPGEMFNDEWIGQDPTADPVLAAYFLFHDCDLATLLWAQTTVRLYTPRRLYGEPVALAPEIPSTYVVATRDRTLRPDWCRRAAAQRLAADIVEVDTGHCPHVSRPEAVADIIA